MNVPKSFSISMLSWVKDTYGMTDEDVAEFVSHNNICLPNGTCFNPGDVGQVCCPFHYYE